MTRKILVEALGTFFLMLTVGQVVLSPGAGAFGPLAVGGVLTAMVYTAYHISGAHYNPAITIAVFIRGKATVHELIGYIICQLVAASIAALIVLWMKQGGPLTLPDLDVPRALVAEFIFTFALAFVVLNVAFARGIESNAYYGLAIGITVMAGTYAVSSISGAAFNPAVTVGSYILGGLGGMDAVLYGIVQLAAGVAAAAVFGILDMAHDEQTTGGVSEQPGFEPPAMP